MNPNLSLTIRVDAKVAARLAKACQDAGETAARFGQAAKLVARAASQAAALSFLPGIAAMARAASEAGERLRDRVLREHWARESRDLWRAKWWLRGEPEPEHEVDANEPEWWQSGDDPPSFGLAA